MAGHDRGPAVSPTASIFGQTDIRAAQPSISFVATAGGIPRRVLGAEPVPGVAQRLATVSAAVGRALAVISLPLGNADQ